MSTAYKLEALSRWGLHLCICINQSTLPVAEEAHWLTQGCKSLHSQVVVMQPAKLQFTRGQ